MSLAITRSGVNTNPIKVERDPGCTCFSAYSRMGNPRYHRQIDQYPVLPSQHPGSANALLRGRNANNNLVLRDTIVLKGLHQPTRPSSNHIRRCILFHIYEGKVLTCVLLEKRSPVLRKL